MPNTYDLTHIRNTFKEYFENWDIVLPENIYEFEVLGEEESNSGWYIAYAFDLAENGQPLLHISAHHRMTNPRHFTILHDGQIQSLEYVQEGYGYDPDIEGDKERSLNEYYIHNRKASAQHIYVGVEPYSFYDGIRISDFYKTPPLEIVYISDGSHFLHPDFVTPFVYRGRSFNSVSHCLNFYKTYYTQTPDAIFDEAQALQKTTESSFIVEPLNQDQGWQMQIDRILIESTLKKLYLTPNLGKQALSLANKGIVFLHEDSFWGAHPDTYHQVNTNKLGLLLTHVIQTFYYLAHENPELI